MSFANAKLILKSTSGLSKLKLLLLTARFSRPRFSPLCNTLLRALGHNDELPLTYTQDNHTFNVSLRVADQQSDLHSFLEVAVRKVYHLNPSFAADLVVDGGANIGLFALQAAAVYPSATILACEPLPRNITEVEKNLARNKVAAEVLPICIGGERRTIPFFCRGANSSSFDPSTPYDGILNIDVLRLSDILNAHPANRILIKLDIEGMEIEALENYVPGEDRAVVIFGELHEHREHRPALERLFAQYGWTLHFGDLSGGDAIFEARSPAAQRDPSAGPTPRPSALRPSQSPSALRPWSETPAARLHSRPSPVDR